MNEAVVNVLKRSRELLSDRSKWTRDRFARDGEGRPVSPTHESAVCFCALGAVVKFAVTKDVEKLARRALETVVGNVTKVNDERTHAEMLGMFDKAIAEASS